MDKKATRNIDTIEELTLFTLDKSQEGLDSLRSGARSCGADIAENRMLDGIKRLASLVEELHEFDMFEYNLCSMFNLDRASFSDSKGNLESNTELFRETLVNISEKLGQNDLKAVSGLLTHELSDSLFRFKELMPLLRSYIDKEYIQPENKK